MLTKNEKKVLCYVMVYSKDFTSINKIARECSLSPNGALKILRKFEKENILNFRKISNSKVYYLNFKSNKTKNIMELVVTPDILDDKINYRFNDLKTLTGTVDICILFGSYITNKKEPSDLDVLFVFDKKNYNIYKEKINKIQEICPVKIHDVIQTKQDLIKNIEKRDKVILNILEKGVILWGQDSLIKVFENVS